MQRFLILFLSLNFYLQAQTRIPFTIIDDHVQDYESTTFEICFDNNADMKSLRYMPFLSSLERPDLQSILEEFYLSPKFESKTTFKNKCIFSTTMQVNSKYESQLSALKDCHKFKTGTFIYGKNNMIGTIIKRTNSTQTEFSDTGFLTSEIEWIDDCNYIMKNVEFENEAFECPNCAILSRIVRIQEDSLLLFSQLRTEKHYLEIIKVNSLNFNQNKSFLKWQTPAFSSENKPNLQENILSITEAVLELDKGNIKYLNAILKLNSEQNLPTAWIEEDPSKTEEFPYADFRLLSAQPNAGNITIEGILTINNVPHKINFTAELIESRKSVVLKAENIILNSKNTKSNEVSATSNSIAVSFELFFEK